MSNNKLLPIEQVYWVQEMLDNSELNFSAMPMECVYAFINSDKSWINRSGVEVDTMMCLNVELTIDGGALNLIRLLEWCNDCIGYAASIDYFELCIKLQGAEGIISEKLESCNLPEPLHESPLPAG